jgi:hypothetical protein
MSLLVVVRHNAREPKFRCLSCNEWVGYEGEERAYETHVVACAQRNEEALRGRSLRSIAPKVFDPHVSGDVEYVQWVRQYRVPLLQGRMKM